MFNKDLVVIKNGTELKVDGKYEKGDLIKFKYSRGENERTSYSKIKNLIPKIESTGYGFIVRMCYLTENEKFITEAMIIKLEVKADPKIAGSLDEYPLSKV